MDYFSGPDGIREAARSGAKFSPPSKTRDNNYFTVCTSAEIPMTWRIIRERGKFHFAGFSLEALKKVFSVHSITNIFYLCFLTKVFYEGHNSRGRIGDAALSRDLGGMQATAAGLR
jgi:hypothetical protein